MITPASFIAVFAEFAAVPTASIQYYIDYATALVCEKTFGPLYNNALTLLTAHFLSLALVRTAGGVAGGVGGQIASEGVGDVSVSFDNSQSTGGADSAMQYYNQTGYGREYLALLRRRIGSPMTTTGLV